MATLKSPVVCARPLPILKPVRISTPLKSSLSNAQPVLPNFPYLRVPHNRLRKKRVRFELKLDPVEEENSLILSLDNSVVATTKANKRITDRWREDRLLNSANINNSGKRDTLTPSISVIKRPARPSLSPESDLESSVNSQSFVVDSKSPEVVIDLFTITTPPHHLPAIVDRRTATPKKNNIDDRRQSLALADPFVKQRVHLATPLHYIRSRKPSTAISNYNCLGPIVKRIDLTTPVTKDFNSSEKLLRIVNPVSTKTIHKHFQSKKTSESN